MLKFSACSPVSHVPRVGGEDTIIPKVFALPSFPDIHYFHCLRIVDLLKGTEASTKNIFGRYSSQRMKASVGQAGELHLETSCLQGLRLGSHSGSTTEAYVDYFLSFLSILKVESKNRPYPWVYIFRPATLGSTQLCHILKMTWWSSQCNEGGQELWVSCDVKAGGASPVCGLS